MFPREEKEEQVTDINSGNDGENDDVVVVTVALLMI